MPKASMSSKNAKERVVSPRFAKRPGDDDGGGGDQESEGEQLPKSPLIVSFNGKRIAISRRCDHSAAMSAVSQARSFRDDLGGRSFYLAAVIPGWGSEPCEVAEAFWSELVQTLSQITVVTLEKNGIPGGAVVPSRRRPYIRFCLLEGHIVDVEFASSDQVEAMKHRLGDYLGRCPSDLRFIHAGKQLEDERTLSDYSITSGSKIHVVYRLRGGKPVILFYSPRQLHNVSVNLSLVKSWSFSAIYPPASVSSSKEFETVNWTVDASPDGLLKDKKTGLDVSYLYWEALTNPSVKDIATPPHSRAASPAPLEIAAFDPAYASVSATEAVCLAIDKVPFYLDRALKAMTLSTEARTSFITYWLPSLLKHKHVALQFLPQKAYEPAAPMAVTPAPDVITRVFMLFRGVSDDDLVSTWANALARAEEMDVESWAEVVGVDVERALDVNLFRVLEWGGMEVVV